MPFRKRGVKSLPCYFPCLSTSKQAGRESWSLKGPCSAAEYQAFPGLTLKDLYEGSAPQSQRSVPRTRPSQEIMTSEGSFSGGIAGLGLLLIHLWPPMGAEQ